MLRSASTWSYNVVIALARGAAPEPRAVVGGFHDRPTSFLAELPKSTDEVVLKSHSLDRLSQSLAKSGRAKVVYTHRDPVDVIVSAMRMWNITFDQALRSLEESLRVYAFHAATGNACILGYEEIMRGTESSVRRIADYLAILATDELVKRVAADTSIEQMKEAANRSEHQVVLESGMRHDADSLLHPDHVRDGGSGYGYEVLSSSQLSVVVKMARRFGVEEWLIPAVR